ncbi:MAG: glycosyltransferase [Elusimicrobia bacterium]|nr:glycosyltransferase [Elusimicrobiota bacterium]
MNNKILLSICIPTYNRVDTLKKTLPQILNFVEKSKYNINVVIGDNASNDGTENYIKSLNSKYIRYYKNNENISADDNFYKILKFSDGEYAFLLGDKHYILEENFNKILSVLEQKKYHAIVSTVSLRNVDISSQIYKNPISFIKDLGWHYTLLSSIFFSRNIIDNFDIRTYKAKNFIHHFILTQYLFNNKVEILWENIEIAKSVLNVVPGWERVSVEIFGRNWSKYILELPFNIDTKIRKEIIRSHSKNTHLFDLIYYYNLRKKYNLSTIDIEKYKDYFDYFSQVKYEKVCQILKDRLNIFDKLKIYYYKIKLNIKAFLKIS